VIIVIFIPLPFIAFGLYRLFSGGPQAPNGALPLGCGILLTIFLALITLSASFSQGGSFLVGIVEMTAGSTETLDELEEMPDLNPYLTILIWEAVILFVLLIANMIVGHQRAHMPLPPPPRSESLPPVDEDTLFGGKLRDLPPPPSED
jgi:hypothetical protein